MKKAIQSLLRLAGYQISKIREPLPVGRPIDVFAACMDELLRKGIKPFVLQIGANDGIAADPVRPFIVSERLPALLLEPHPDCFVKLQNNYAGFDNVRTLNIAISDRRGELSLFVPNDTLLKSNPRLSGLCTLSRDQLVKELIRERKSNPGSLIKEIRIQARTVSDLIRDEHIEAIDVLQIDTEGHDWRILSQFDLVALGISLINMEWFHLNRSEQTACMNHLTKLGYATATVFGDLVAYKR